MPTPPDDLISALLSAPPTILALLLGLAALGVVAIALRVVLYALSKEVDR